MIKISNNEYIKVDDDIYIHLVSNFFVIKKSTGKIHAFYKQLGRASSLGYREAYQYLIIYQSGLVRDVIISRIAKLCAIFPSTEYDVYQLNPEAEPMLHVML